MCRLGYFTALAKFTFRLPDALRLRYEGKGMVNLINVKDI